LLLPIGLEIVRLVVVAVLKIATNNGSIGDGDAEVPGSGDWSRRINIIQAWCLFVETANLDSV
jgi:hypothetical protein